MRGTQRDIPRGFVAIVLALAALRIAVETGWLGLPGSRRADLVAWSEPSVAEKRSMDEGKPMLIDFDADWCGPCRELDAVSWHDPEIADRIGRAFVAARVTSSSAPAGDTEDGDAWRERFGVQAFPTLVVVVPGSERPLLRTGYCSPEQVRELLDRAEMESLARRRLSAPRPPGDTPARSPRDPSARSRRDPDARSPRDPTARSQRDPTP
jgi:thiol:disulfide interchange protein